MIIIKTLLMSIGIVILFSILLAVYDALLEQWYASIFKNRLKKQLKRLSDEIEKSNKE